VTLLNAVRRCLTLRHCYAATLFDAATLLYAADAVQRCSTLLDAADAADAAETDLQAYEYLATAAPIKDGHYSLRHLNSDFEN
jgi:hypothetical protein